MWRWCVRSAGSIAAAWVLWSVVGQAWAQPTGSAAEPPGETARAFAAVGDAEAMPDAQAAQGVLDLAVSEARAQDAEVVGEPAGPTPEQLAPLRAQFDAQLAILQQQADSLDAVTQADMKAQLEAAIAQVKQMMEGQAPGAAAAEPAASVAALELPAEADRELGFDEALASLRQIVRDRAPAEAIAAFEASEDYKSPSRCAAAAIIAIDSRRYLAALAALLRAHELQPGDATHLVNLGGLVARFGLPRHALALLKRAEELDGLKPGAFGVDERAALLTNRGHALVQLGLHADAEAALREAVTLDPQLAEARANLAHALYRQDDPQKKAQGVMFLRAAGRRATVKTAEDALAPSEPPQTPVPGEVDIRKDEAAFEASLVVQRAGRRPAAELFDLSRGKRGGMPTIKTPKTIMEGAALYPKVEALHAEITAKLAANTDEMNRVETEMRERENRGEMSPAASRRARAIFWYIGLAHTEPELRRLYMDAFKANGDDRIGLWVETGFNPWGSRELHDRHMEILNSDAPWPDKCQAMWSATEPWHGKWLGPIHNFATAINQYHDRRYRHATALAANIHDPLYHRYAKLLIEQNHLGITQQYLEPLRSVCRYEEAFVRIYGPSGAEVAVEDIAPGEYEEPEACHALFSGEYKAKVEIGFLEIAGNCEKIGIEASAGEWVKSFAEVEITFEGEITVFVGGAGEAKIPGAVVTPAAEVKSGVFIKWDADGEIEDAGFKVARSSSINVGVDPVSIGYEREIETEYSATLVVAAFRD